MAYEKCPIDKTICAYCSKDENKELRCGIGVKTKKGIENHISLMEKCPKGK